MSTMAKHSYAGLYYPFIHFKDERWLKLSALYWDQMGRIVPSGYTPQDGDAVRELGSFVETLRPEWVGPNFGPTFVEFVEAHGRQLRGRYGVSLREKWPVVPPAERPPTAGGPSGSDPRLSYVFYEKMAPTLREVLVTSGIAVPDDHDPRWIGMHPKLAQVYMTALADELAGERGLYPLTDETLDHLAIGGRSVERLAQALLDDVDLVNTGPTVGEVESVAAYVAIRTVLPTDIDRVPIDRILEFREKYPGERAAFQQHLAEYIKPREWLRDMRDPATLERRLESEYDKELKPKLAELQEKLREVRIDTVAGVLGIQVAVPSVVVQGAALAGVVANPFAALAAGAALAVLPVLRDRRKAQRELKSSPFAYLMRVERDLAPRQIVDWIRTTAKRFRFV
jgi:hypothetical protein